ncbi:Nucleotide-binding, alpha-beta plait [Artemisia annua]|uniref:Nucleotide-binding, alpha-beta plait n=1 Tax=Artemisia annua TaxID=35608 RepID=A0A2U1LQF1_ARTAN|nr:Nucleotide-binding, alpha-beta plait [Artemisia annua]
MASLHLLSSKTLNPITLPKPIIPTSFQTPFSIPTSIKPIPSFRTVPKVALSHNLELNNGFLSSVEKDGFKLFVGNLPFHVGDLDLAKLFQTCGNVVMVEVVYDKLNRRSRGFGFVTMSSVKEAEAAAKKFDGYELEGRQLRVNYGPPPSKKSFIKEPKEERNDINTNTVYVGNLSWSVDNETLETLFWEHGNVMQAKVHYDKDSGRSRGFGFVTYSCADEVYSAVESLDGVDLDGRNIRVSVAVPPQRHS